MVRRLNIQDDAQADTVEVMDGRSCWSRVSCAPRADIQAYEYSPSLVQIFERSPTKAK
jgi:hypothetical protein